jgi:glycosyltransferase involved in cell wall biosynthesis
MKKIIYEMASGEFIAVHHSDNIWEPEKLQKQAAYLEAHPDTGAVFTDSRNINEAGETLDDKPNKDINRSRHQWLNHFFYKGNALYHPTVLIRKKCFDASGFYRNGLVQIPDFDLWVRLCMKYEIHVIPEKLIRYRVRSDNLNISGIRPETRIRLQFEFLQLLENYTKISTFEELVKIFPSAEKYYRSDGYDVGYILGMTALETQARNVKQKQFGIPTYHLFGLKLLFEALNDPARANKIKELYGFEHKDLIALTGSHDVFSFEENKYLRSKLSEKEQKQVRWKIASFFSRTGEALFPRKSLQYRLLRKLYKSIHFPHKDIYN